MTWTTELQAPRPGVQRHRVLRDDAALSYADALGAWEEDAAFRAFFIDLLAGAPFEAYCWETPPVSAATAGRDFEFVLLDSPNLAGKLDSESFANQFAAAGDKPVIGFSNLGRDAYLVVPCPRGGTTDYGHLAAFVRSASEEQKHALWRAVGATMLERLGDRRIWLSTAGGGVAWVHVRLDSRPKYYGFRAYAVAA
jgi:hypothetical protein